MQENRSVLIENPPLPDVSLAEMPRALALATSPQLLTLLRILGTGPSVVADRLAVSRTPVSLWMAGKRTVPKKYVAAIAVMAQEAFRVAQAQMHSALSTLASVDHQRAFLAAFRAPLALWVQEVFYEQQQMVRGLLACCEHVAEQAESYQAHLHAGQQLTGEGRAELALSCQAMLSTLKGFAQLVAVPQSQGADKALETVGR
jgi:hypothetical protein